MYTDFLSLVVVPFVFLGCLDGEISTRLVGLFFSAAQNVTGFCLALVGILSRAPPPRRKRPRWPPWPGPTQPAAFSPPRRPPTGESLDRLSTCQG